MLQLMGLQRVRHNLATEQQKSTKKEAKKKKKYNGEEMCWKNWTSTCKRIKLDHFVFTSYPK